jgi:hypothetical protein
LALDWSGSAARRCPLLEGAKIKIAAIPLILPPAAEQEIVILSFESLKRAVSAGPIKSSRWLDLRFDVN